ncbi:MAG: 4Fe-4S binding protein [Pseudodesulfovibrio sp.]
MKKQITPARFRLVIQLVFTLFCIYVGFRFAAFLSWALGESTEYVARPGAVEGFLPISALLGFRQLLSEGIWDVVHPAGLTIFLALIVMAFLFRKGFCGYICPVGFISNLFERIGRKMKLAIIPHKWIDYPLMTLKYGLLGFFAYIVFFSMSIRSVGEFMTGPYNVVADAKMLALFTNPTAMTLMVLLVLAALSIVIRNVWCRYLCPYGALLGLFAWFGPTAIARDESTCIDCGQCTKGCPSGITVHEKESVRSPECIGCAECIGNCPVDDCLSFKVYKRVKIPWFAVGIGAVAVLLGFYLWARMTGHWDPSVPAEMFRKIYPMFLKIS